MAYYNKDDIFPISRINLYDKKYYCPNNYDTYLKGIYSDKYSELPPVVQFHQRLPKLREYKITEEFFKSHLEYMHNANENFK